jgi:NDP-sugar pyrophosphorylase family protein
MLPLSILAGGFASRLGPLTENLPKSLVEVNGRPFIDWQIELLSKHGYSDYVFCVSHKSEMLEKHLGDGSRFGVNIKYSFDGERQLGTAGAIRKALPLLGDRFGVVYGDSYLPISYSAVEADFLNSGKDALMTVYKTKNGLGANNTEYSDGQILNHDKTETKLNMKHIDYGLSYFSATAFSGLKIDEYFDLSHLFKQLLDKRQIIGFEVFTRFYEIGSITGLMEFSDYLRKGDHELQ